MGPMNDRTSTQSAESLEAALQRQEPSFGWGAWLTLEEMGENEWVMVSPSVVSSLDASLSVRAMKYIATISLIDAEMTRITATAMETDYRAVVELMNGISGAQRRDKMQKNAVAAALASTPDLAVAFLESCTPLGKLRDFRNWLAHFAWACIGRERHRLGLINPKRLARGFAAQLDYIGTPAKDGDLRSDTTTHQDGAPASSPPPTAFDPEDVWCVSVFDLDAAMQLAEFVHLRLSEVTRLLLAPPEEREKRLGIVAALSYD